MPPVAPALMQCLGGVRYGARFFAAGRLLKCAKMHCGKLDFFVILFSLLLRNALGVLLVIDFCWLGAELHAEG